MVKKGLENFAWLKGYLEKISEFGQEMEDGGITTNYRAHTTLKLIVLYYTAEVFSKVARSDNQRKKGFDGAVYVDLLAGTGLVKLNDTGDIVAGSAPCAMRNKYGFDYSVMVEEVQKKCKHLENRISRIPGNNEFDIITGDVNEKIYDVIDKIKERYERPIILTFADPEGLEIKFRTLKILNDEFLNCDFLVNVDDDGVRRVAGRIRNGIQNGQILEDYLDEDSKAVLQGLEDGKSPQEIYASQISNVLGKEIGDIIPIHDKGNKIAYHLLGYTRRTGGDSGYSRAFSALKEKIEWADGNDVKKALDMIHNRASSLDDFQSSASES